MTPNDQHPMPRTRMIERNIAWVSPRQSSRSHPTSCWSCVWMSSLVLSKRSRRITPSECNMISRVSLGSTDTWGRLFGPDGLQSGQDQTGGAKAANTGPTTLCTCPERLVHRLCNVDKIGQQGTALGAAQLLERDGLKLTNALTTESVESTNFSQGMRAIRVQAKA